MLILKKLGLIGFIILMIGSLLLLLTIFNIIDEITYTKYILLIGLFTMFIGQIVNNKEN